MAYVLNRHLSTQSGSYKRTNANRTIVLVLPGELQSVIFCDTYLTWGLMKQKQVR